MDNTDINNIIDDITDVLKIKLDETMYSMKLNDTLKINKYTVVERVPGGWLYHTRHYADGVYGGPPVVTFVAYNNEFNTNKGEK